MAVAYLNDGSTSVAAANWSDATGFAANATLVISNQTQTIDTALDQSASGDIDYLWIMGGSPRIEGAANAPLKVAIDAAHTADPNFVWAARGGRCRVEFTNTVPEVIITGGGEVTLASGTITRLVIVGSARVNILAALDVATELVVGGSAVVDIADKASDNIPTLTQYGQSLVVSRRRIVTLNGSGGVTDYENTSGSSTTTVNQSGTHKLVPRAGSVATYNRNGGMLDLSRVEQAITIGATAVVNKGPDPFPKSSGLVTVSNVTDYVDGFTFASGGTTSGGVSI